MNGLTLHLQKQKKNFKCLINLAKTTYCAFTIRRRFVYWTYLPNEIQSKILSYFKFNVEYCLILFLKVSKSFEQHVEQMHLDIYNMSLGICSKKTWLNKTLPIFNEMIRSFDMFCDQTFDDLELLMVYSEGSIFRTFLHFFLCSRSCDGLNNYCSQCSHVRFRNFQNQVLFDNVLLPVREFKSKLGLDDRIVDFDVYLPNYVKYDKNGDKICKRERIINFAADIYVMFLSIFIRVNLNVCYEYFLSFPLTIDNKKYFIRKIQHYVRDLSCEIWGLNVNHFFVVFAKFSELNRSICFDLADLVDLYRSLPIT